MKVIWIDFAVDSGDESSPHAEIIRIKLKIDIYTRVFILIFLSTFI